MKCAVNCISANRRAVAVIFSDMKIVAIIIKPYDTRESLPWKQAIAKDWCIRLFYFFFET